MLNVIYVVFLCVARDRVCGVFGCSVCGIWSLSNVSFNFRC